MTINIVRVVCDALYKKGIFDKEAPIKGQVAFMSIGLGGLIFEGLAVADEEEIVMWLLHLYKRIFKSSELSKKEEGLSDNIELYYNRK